MDLQLLDTYLHAIRRYEDLHYLNEGWLYSTGQHWQDVADQNEKKVLIENNYDDVALGIYEPTVRAGGSTIVGKVFNPSVDTQGNSPDSGIVNKSSSQSNTTSVTAQLGGDNETGVFSGGTAFSDKQLGGGANPSSVSPGSVGTQGISNMIKPGDSMTIEGFNDAGTTINMSIDIDWVELPQQLL